MYISNINILLNIDITVQQTENRPSSSKRHNMSHESSTLSNIEHSNFNPLYILSTSHTYNGDMESILKLIGRIIL